MTAVILKPARPGARVLTSADAAAALVPEWEGLLSRSACDVPFLSPQWLLPWWRVFGHLGGRRPAVMPVEESGRLIGLALLSFRWHRYRPGLPFRRVELWGSGEDERDSICSDYLNVIAEKDREPTVASAFARALARCMDAWHEMVVPLMDTTHPMPALLVREFRALGLEAELTPTTEAPYIPLPTTWEAYLAGLDRKDRYLIKRSQRDFDDWAAGSSVVHEASSEAEIEKGAAVLRSLHGERWEGTGGGTFRSPRFLEFHGHAMRAMLRAGGLRLTWLTVRGEPAAAMYSVARGGKVAFYQCGRRLDVPKGVRPGGVLLYHAIRRAIEAGEKEFDFLGGEAVYKRQLASAARPLAQLRVVRPGWRESARRLLEWGKGLLRGLFRPRQPQAPEDTPGADPG